VGVPKATEVDRAPAELLLAALIWLAEALRLVAENGGAGVMKNAVIASN
jgi:hypothetical protein